MQTRQLLCCVFQASSEEITFAYRRLSKIYHPDKHVDESKKKEAEILFNKTQKAYEGRYNVYLFLISIFDCTFFL